MIDTSKLEQNKIYAVFSPEYGWDRGRYVNGVFWLCEYAVWIPAKQIEEVRELVLSYSDMPLITQARTADQCPKF